MNNKLDNTLTTLNEQQLEAVMHKSGPLFVVAGAGTGKTNTLTTRIAYLIDKEGINPESILGVTFTNKAAREIRLRVNNLISPKEMGTWLYTFHAFSLQVLRANAELLELGYSKHFTVIDESDARRAIKHVIEQLNLDSKSYPTRHSRGLISQFKMGLTTFNDINYHNIHDGYQKYLQEQQLMDFDDLLLYTLELLKTNEAVRSYYQNKFEHILVDEFQDTDKVQYEIIKILSKKHNNTVVVGDPDQSIYGFRGSRYENNDLFIKEFNAKTIVLDKNYRSTNNILRVANALIDNNQDRPGGKHLKSDYGDGASVTFYQANDDYDETYFVANEIRQLLRKGYEHKDIAVLYRNNNLSRLFEHAFTQNSIPYVIYGGLSFYERREVKDILSYIRVIVNPNSDFYLKRIINVPARGIGKVSLGKLEDYAAINNYSMFDAIPEAKLGGRAAKTTNEFYTLINELREEINAMTDIVDAIDLVYRKSGYHDLLKQDDDETSKERRDNIYELKNVFRAGSWKYEGDNLQVLQNILDEISLYTDMDKKLPSDDVVKLATIHQVKGLEFKVVFVVVLEDTIFPSDRSLSEVSGLEEERRVAYVALTRAKERLYVSCAKKRMLYGQVLHLDASQFMSEMQVRDKYSESSSEVIVTEGMDFIYKAGDTIHHAIFGTGVVVETKNGILTIAFGIEHGMKKLLEDHPALTRIK